MNTRFIPFCMLFMLSGVFMCDAKRDTAYIRVHNDQLILSAYYGMHFAELDYGKKDKSLQTYFPNTGPEFSVGVAWNWLAASVRVYGIRPNSEHGNTKAFDFQSHWFFSKIQFSLSLQNYKGFYTKDNKELVLRPDLKVKMYRVYGQYLFNNKNFSYRSAFTYDEQQLHSAGSLKVGIGAYYSLISADSTLLFNNTARMPKNAEDYQIAPNVGYAYNFIYGKRNNWFSNVSLTGGLGISIKNNDHKVKVYPTFYPRVAFGYNGRNWTMGVSAQLLHTRISKVDGISTNLNSGLAQLTFSYRIPFDLRKIFK